MKQVLAGLFIVSLVANACNNAPKDNVEKTDSLNRDRINSPGAGQPVATDEETASFLVKATDGEMTQMQLGQLAEEKSLNQDIKELGAWMVHDHAAWNNEIKTLAAQRNVYLPDSIGDDSFKKINSLNDKAVRAFDKSYTEALIKQYQSTIELFENAEGKVNDTEVRTFINNTLPKAKRQLDSVRVIDRSVK